METAEGEVTISFSGGLPLRQIATPDIAEDNGIAKDLLAAAGGVSLENLPAIAASSYIGAAAPSP